jgi:hypothetical protein
MVSEQDSRTLAASSSPPSIRKRAALARSTSLGASHGFAVSSCGSGVGSVIAEPEDCKPPGQCEGSDELPLALGLERALALHLVAPVLAVLRLDPTSSAGT